jgi:hypothetical protein
LVAQGEEMTMDELTSEEKATEGLYKLAAMMWEYYDALMEKGFVDEDALKIALEWQALIVSAGAKK